MRAGSLLFDTWQGLGVLGKSFVDAGVVTDVMVVEHGRRPSNRDWYPNAPRIGDLRDHAKIREWLSHLDVFLAFETPFVWEVFRWCRDAGVKTVLMPMHECEPDLLPAHPDVFLCPSLLDLDCYPDGHWQTHKVGKDYLNNKILVPINTRSVFLPVPVEAPWRRRERAWVFVHNAGNGGLRGRNGTAELLASLRYVESPITMILRTQEHRPEAVEVPDHVTLDWHNGTVLYDTLYERGDVFVMPEKFNGLSLPLQEARAAGMLVMCGDRYPMNTWLPREPLIPVAGYNKVRIARHLREFDEAQFDPRVIAATIDSWFGKDISAYSDGGREWAATMSWEVLKPRYTELLESLCSS